MGIISKHKGARYMKNWTDLQIFYQTNQSAKHMVQMFEMIRKVSGTKGKKDEGNKTERNSERVD